jgi:hypothetical protein
VANFCYMQRTPVMQMLMRRIMQSNSIDKESRNRCARSIASIQKQHRCCQLPLNTAVRSHAHLVEVLVHHHLQERETSHQYIKWPIRHARPTKANIVYACSAPPISMLTRLPRHLSCHWEAYCLVYACSAPPISMLTRLPRHLSCHWEAKQ